MSIDYAHTPLAERQRREKAKTLARWCYEHGIDDRILRCPPVLRRKAARAAGVPPPHEPPGEVGETWHLVADLLARRGRWDREHGQMPPVAASCVACAIPSGNCQQHPDRAPGTRCRVCGGQLHEVLLTEGQATHPTCDPHV